MKASETFDKSKRFMLWMSSALIVLVLSTHCNPFTIGGADDLSVSAPSLGIPINRNVLIAALWISTVYAAIEYYFERRNFRTENNEILAGRGKGHHEQLSAIISVLQHSSDMINSTNTSELEIKVKDYNALVDDFQMNFRRYLSGARNSLVKWKNVDGEVVLSENHEKLVGLIDAIDSEISKFSTGVDRVSEISIEEARQLKSSIEDIKNKLDSFHKTRGILEGIDKKISSIYRSDGLYNISQWHLVESSVPILFVALSLLSPLIFVINDALFVCGV